MDTRYFIRLYTEGEAYVLHTVFYVCIDLISWSALLFCLVICRAGRLGRGEARAFRLRSAL